MSRRVITLRADKRNLLCMLLVGGDPEVQYSASTRAAGVGSAFPGAREQPCEELLPADH